MAAPRHTALRNLTMASAKHLVAQGHISPAHHKRILKKIRAPKQQGTPAEAGTDAPSFGALSPSMPASPSPMGPAGPGMGMLGAMMPPEE